MKHSEPQQSANPPGLVRRLLALEVLHFEASPLLHLHQTLSSGVFPFQSVYPVNPPLSRRLGDVAQGKAVKLTTGKRTALMRMGKRDILSFAQSPLFPFSLDVFISLLFPPEVTTLMGLIRLWDVS